MKHLTFSKKLIALLLAIAMIAAIFAACSKDEKPEEPDPDNTTSTSDTPDVEGSTQGTQGGQGGQTGIVPMAREIIATDDFSEIFLMISEVAERNYRRFEEYERNIAPAVASFDSAEGEMEVFADDAGGNVETAAVAPAPTTDTALPAEEKMQNPTTEGPASEPAPDPNPGAGGDRAVGGDGGYSDSDYLSVMTEEEPSGSPSSEPGGEPQAMAVDENAEDAIGGGDG
ncbi:MAG: hypothetical protein FWH20_02185, partial [Oscillospiraceae bacterium]|nr:hypothetical protein [Oscillospiraceae bacterium]